jgi:hypothetical protein
MMDVTAGWNLEKLNFANLTFRNRLAFEIILSANQRNDPVPRGQLLACGSSFGAEGENIIWPSYRKHVLRRLVQTAPPVHALMRTGALYIKMLTLCRAR